MLILLSRHRGACQTALLRFPVGSASKTETEASRYPSPAPKTQLAHVPCSAMASGNQIPDGLILSEIPALAPPPGIEPNFVNPPSKGQTLIIFGSLILGLMLLFVGMRIYAKRCIIRQFSWDDREFLYRMNILHSRSRQC